MKLYSINLTTYSSRHYWQLHQYDHKKRLWMTVLLCWRHGKVKDTQRLHTLENLKNYNLHYLSNHNHVWHQLAALTFCNNWKKLLRNSPVKVDSSIVNISEYLNLYGEAVWWMWRKLMSSSGLKWMLTILAKITKQKRILPKPRLGKKMKMAINSLMHLAEVKIP